ncbi:hypothetical protein NP493_233g01019 [Ridgeia piscesae]|uniref:Uncharacterized protein n=1 Tax=Ridgeia piscesae TaxID=27915 RepID=A0AAD9NZP8_RIDPI|nr:hypothetical protein NP493_233g01019 [Ridgeia piscesae]
MNATRMRLNWSVAKSSTAWECASVHFASRKPPRMSRARRNSSWVGPWGSGSISSDALAVSSPPARGAPLPSPLSTVNPGSSCCEVGGDWAAVASPNLDSSATTSGVAVPFSAILD